MHGANHDRGARVCASHTETAFCNSGDFSDDGARFGCAVLDFELESEALALFAEARSVDGEIQNGDGLSDAGDGVVAALAHEFALWEPRSTVGRIVFGRAGIWGVGLGRVCAAIQS